MVAAAVGIGGWRQGSVVDGFAAAANQGGCGADLWRVMARQEVLVVATINTRCELNKDEATQRKHEMQLDNDALDSN